MPLCCSDAQTSQGSEAGHTHTHRMLLCCDGSSGNCWDRDTRTHTRGQTLGARCSPAQSRPQGSDSEKATSDQLRQREAGRREEARSRSNCSVCCSSARPTAAAVAAATAKVVPHFAADAAVTTTAAAAAAAASAAAVAVAAAAAASAAAAAPSAPYFSLVLVSHFHVPLSLTPCTVQTRVYVCVCGRDQ